MKTNVKASMLLVAISAIFSFNSCSDKDPDPVTPPIVEPVCLITKIQHASDEPYIITYNSDRSVNTVTNGSSVSTFTYSAGSIIRLHKTGEAFDYKEIYTLNPQNLITNYRAETNEAGTTWENNAYEYTGNEPTKVTFTSSSGSLSYSAALTWTNGNYVKAIPSDDPTHPIAMTHDVTQPFQQGDYFYNNYIREGYFLYKNKNLITSVNSGGSSTRNFVYIFDTDGKITSLDIRSTSSGGTTSSYIYNYTYQCN